jgi:hypothetical protein
MPVRRGKGSGPSLEIIAELEGYIDPDDGRQYLMRLMVFMASLNSSLSKFIESLIREEETELYLRFPEGADPKTLFLDDMQEIDS